MTLQVYDATPDTVPKLEVALRQLARDLDDPYRMDSDTLAAALFGPHAACFGALAMGEADAVLGATLYAPVTSTAAGRTGVYVSDLWVAEAARGQALGPALLAHVAARARQLWDARFLRLVSYRTNDRARSFYTRLGFVEKSDELVLQLSGEAFDQFNR
ncbi:N-acetyltransferase [Primorskyibacter aestuariivivens]|uniref:GNAT family N-acetyltransferase n=1 Tax=Primorskyibacter aestuariivivens TaxID=1888912 RepID=UPI002301E120|nr:N-acetyltransferase [Primorskyibacter aestuariivivens]MDA7427932.1 N-acetyltransferase [Primorskyibacter aestuariivivens]